MSHREPIKRRDFIIKSAQAASLLALSGTAYGIGGCAPEEKKLGVALLGLGGYATGQLAPALQLTQHCRLAGIVTGTPSKVAEWQQKYDIPDKNVYNYENFDTIRNNPEIDIVYVVTPNALHMPFAVRAAEAGKHVICEKPMEISSDRCRQIIAACEKAGKKLQVGYRLQYDPYHREMMRLAEEETYGKVKMINTGFSFYGVGRDNWRFTDASLSGGGPLMDIGIYSLQGARYTLDAEPVSITAQSFKTMENELPGMEETIFWQMEFPNGAVVNCSSSYVGRENYIRVSAEKGVFGLEPAFSYNGLAGYINGEAMPAHEHNQQAAQMDAFALNIKEDTPVIASGEEGLRDMIIIEAIYEAARTGKKIIL